MLEEVKLYDGGMKAFIKVRKLCGPQIKELKYQQKRQDEQQSGFQPLEHVSQWGTFFWLMLRISVF
jgi:hypothetical protein